MVYESSMRMQIANIVSPAKAGDKISRFYDLFIISVSIISLFPLTVKESTPIMNTIDVITVYILFFDYFLRWISYDKISKFRPPYSFFVYPFVPISVLDMVSLLPSLGILGPGYRILRLFRVVKIVQYSKGFRYIANAFKKERKTLIDVLILAIGYIFVSALFIFCYEPNTFDNFFDAVYWATVSLTTVGYGDIYPTTDVGRLISMVSSLFGVAIIAMPAGIITASFVEELNIAKQQEEKRRKAQKQKNKIKKQKRDFISILERDNILDNGVQDYETGSNGQDNGKEITNDK